MIGPFSKSWCQSENEIIFCLASAACRRTVGALQAEEDALKRLQAETAAELDALLDRAFKGEL